VYEAVDRALASELQRADEGYAKRRLTPQVSDTRP
jgi:hypothetical protein